MSRGGDAVDTGDGGAGSTSGEGDDDDGGAWEGGDGAGIMRVTLSIKTTMRNKASMTAAMLSNFNSNSNFKVCNAEGLQTPKISVTFCRRTRNVVRFVAPMLLKKDFTGSTASGYRCGPIMACGLFTLRHTDSRMPNNLRKSVKASLDG